MALKSAQAAGVEVPTGTLFRVARFFDAVTMPSGEVIYANMDPSRYRRGWSIAAVGMVSNQLLGLPTNDRVARAQAAMVLSHPPDWKTLSDWKNPTERGVFDSIYFWYYGTLGLFQVGDKAWEQWNEAMKKTLLVHQRRGGCLEGSWDPSDVWGLVGGRIYSTTLNILNLEIYYRYLPLYSGGTLRTVDALVFVIEKGNRTDGVEAIRLLGRFNDEKARQYLVKLANGDDHQLAMEASVALAERRDSAAIAPLLAQLKSANQFERYRAVRALSPMVGQGLVPVFIELLRDEKATVARQADLALRQFASASFGFEPEAPASEREAAIRKWQDWWEQRLKGSAKAESLPPWLVVRVASDKGFVVFSTGKPGAASAGDRCNVHRGERYIGRISVVKVDGEVCLGKILETYTAGEVQEGDVVKPGT